MATPWRWRRVAGYAGIGFVVLFIPALIIQRTSPYTGAPIDETPGRCGQPGDVRGCSASHDHVDEQ